MHRVEFKYPGPAFKQKLLHWAAKQPFCVFLDSCDTETDRYGAYDFLLGVSFSEDPPLLHNLEELAADLSESPLEWRFGVCTYDLKNDIEPRLSSKKDLNTGFAGLRFFRPDVVISKAKNSDQIVFHKGYAVNLIRLIHATELPAPGLSAFSGFAPNFSREEYLETIESLRNHIREGDSYEINLAQEYLADVHIESPAALWEALKALSPVPFAGFARWKEQYLLCASPERFLQLQSGRMLTQPIKGTAPRSSDPKEDAELVTKLRASLKEQAENVMIVDLSRNDLYRSCEVNSVEVPELFEVQTFPQVHHLVSTITGQKRKDVHPVAALRNNFPPGSMTGAPKIRSCELIDDHERSARGLYAGSLGYFAPGGDFDLNVVIRSLVYESGKKQISYHVGGAITWDSKAEAEYEETLIKAKAIEDLFARFS